MSHVHNPPRWLDANDLPTELHRELSAYAAEAPHVARRARMLASLEQQLGFAEVPAIEPASSVAQPALGGVAGAGTGALVGALVKLKLVLGVLATAGAALGAWSVWSSAASAPHHGIAAHGAPEASSAAFRAVDPAVSRWAVAGAELAPSRVASASFEPGLPAPGELFAPTGEVALRADDREVALAPGPAARRERKAKQVAPPPAELDALGQLDALMDDLSTGATSGPLSELTLLARARRSLLSSPERSLELAEQHAREFPAGTLCEEREVLAIESLLKLGRVDRAQQRALAFERSFPSSAHRAHLARLIARPAR